MLKRILVSLLIGMILGAAISELSFIFQHDTARPPQDVMLTIPAGTAAQVARGDQPPSIPQDMIFVVGDTLVMKNAATLDHTLAPLSFPPNSPPLSPLHDAAHL